MKYEVALASFVIEADSQFQAEEKALELLKKRKWGHKHLSATDNGYSIPWETSTGITCLSCMFFKENITFCQVFNASTTSDKYCNYHKFIDTEQGACARRDDY